LKPLTHDLKLGNDKCCSTVYYPL